MPALTRGVQPDPDLLTAISTVEDRHARLRAHGHHGPHPYFAAIGVDYRPVRDATRDHVEAIVGRIREVSTTEGGGLSEEALTPALFGVLLRGIAIGIEYERRARPRP